MRSLSFVIWMGIDFAKTQTESSWVSFLISIISPLPSLSKSLQDQSSLQSSYRKRSLEITRRKMWYMWQSILCQKRPIKTFQDSYRRKTIWMQVLSEKILRQESRSKAWTRNPPRSVKIMHLLPYYSKFFSYFKPFKTLIVVHLYSDFYELWI